MNKDQLIQLVISRIPYPAQICSINTVAENNAIRFDWRGGRYRITLNFEVEECVDGMLCGSDKTILMQALISNKP